MLSLMRSSPTLILIPRMLASTKRLKSGRFLMMFTASTEPFLSLHCSPPRCRTRRFSVNPRTRALHLPLSPKFEVGIRALLCPLLHSSLPPSPASATGMAVTEKGAQIETPSMKLLFVEMGVGYDQHGQNITTAAMRACKDAISSNSIPAFRSGSIPGVNTDQMKLLIKLGVPRSTQQSLDIESVKSVFPYGQILNVEVVDGGMICSSGVCLEAMGDKNDDCYIVNAAVVDFIAFALKYMEEMLRVNEVK